MRVVQALHWLKDTLSTDRQRVLNKLNKMLVDPVHGDAVRKDLLEGFSTLPTWMQSLVRELPGCDPKTATTMVLKRPKASASAKLHHLKSAIGEAA